MGFFNKKQLGGYGSYQAPTMQGGLGILGGSIGRTVAPSTFVAPDQKSFLNVFDAAKKGFDGGRGNFNQAMQNTQGITSNNPGMVAGQYGNLLPYAMNYWGKRFDKGRVKTKDLKAYGAPQFNSGDEFAKWAQFQPMNYGRKFKF